MEKYTPGPWRRLRPNGEIVVSTVAVNEDYKQICNCTPHFHPDLTDEFAANANLIATAPELLEVLKRIVARGDKPLQSIHIDEARAIIAKATKKG